jgi:exodeoxyribonuclease V alpha subunit
MIDLPTMRALLEALPTSAMLVLIGDPDQLQSVAAGTVLADLTAALAAQGCVAQLSHSFRSAAAWQPLLAAIRAGHTELPPSPIERIGSADAPQAALLAWAQRHGWHRRGRWQTAAAIASLREAQILCALRAGPTGSEALSAMLDDWLRRDAGSAEPWYPGRVVMFTRNDLATGLNNGDLGIAIDIDGALRIATGDERQPRLLAPGELPEHQPAFAITVHKSQGSEYRHIALVLPPRPDHPLLTRQLLYTALSRARESVALLGDEAALAAAVARPAERIGGLRLRIAGA